MVAFILTGANLARRSGSTAPSAVPAPAIAKQPLPEPSNAMGAQLVNAVADPGASNSTPPKFLVHPGSVLVNPGSMENAETQQVKFPK
jgi:hypothetical protein